MKQLKELVRLKFALGRSYSEIASSLGVARSSVRAALKRFSVAGLSWPLDEGLDDAALPPALANAERLCRQPYRTHSFTARRPDLRH